MFFTTVKGSMEIVKHSAGSTAALAGAGCMQQLALALDHSTAADNIGCKLAQRTEAAESSSKEFVQLVNQSAPDGPRALESHAVKTADCHVFIARSDRKYSNRLLQQLEEGPCHGMLVQKDDYVEKKEMMVCLPQLPMSRLLRACMARAQNRCRSAWMMLQVISTLSQFLGVMVLLPQDLLLRRSPFTRSPLPVWALGYALACLAYLPLLLLRTRPGPCRSSGKRIRTSDTTVDLHYDVQLGAACTISEEDVRWQLAAGAGGPEEGPRLDENKLRLRSCLEFFFAVWFVMGLIWVFGRPATCAQASPTLYSLCVTLLLISAIRYMMVVIMCGALCCSLQPRTSRTSIQPTSDGGKQKRDTQQHIDAGLPISLLQKKETITHAFSTNKAMHDQRNDSGCCICLNTFKENTNVRVLPCSHYFHADCVDKWLMMNASCPLCKSILQPKGLPFLFDILKQSVFSLDGELLL